MLTVLFVCTGNTCRSPMAQLVLQNMLENKSLQETVRVYSAGIYAQDNDSISDKAKKALLKQDISAEGFSSKRLNKELLDLADCVFVMTKSHLNVIANLYPDLKQKVSILSDENDVCDPFGKTQKDYDDCLQELIKLINRVLPKIINFKKEIGECD